MSKELLENLLIEFDEMNYEPTILCDTKREVESFGRRLKQVLDYLKAIENTNPSEALKCLRDLKVMCGTRIELDKFPEYNIVEQALIKSQEQEKFLDDKLLFKDTSISCGFDYKGKHVVAMPLDEYSILMEQEKVLEIIKEHPFESASTINYIKINKDNPKMLDYKCYCMSLDVDFRVMKEEFELLKRYVENEIH